MPESNTSNGHETQPGAAEHEQKAESNQTIEAGAAAALEALQAQVKEKENKYLYLYADFENFKKRAIKERSDLIKFGWESVARDLLQVVDNLERAVHFAPAQTDKNLLDGLNMVVQQFKTTLQKQGVETVKSLNETFNPELHEAVGQEPSDRPSGTITQVHQPGYVLHGRLLRPARVVISSGPAAQ